MQEFYFLDTYIVRSLMTLSKRQRIIVNCKQKSIQKVVVAYLRVSPGNSLKKQRKNPERLR